METIDIELTDEEFCVLAKEAHAQDITFNKYIEQILVQFLAQYKQTNTGVSTSPA